MIRLLSKHFFLIFLFLTPSFSWAQYIEGSPRSFDEDEATFRDFASEQTQNGQILEGQVALGLSVAKNLLAPPTVGYQTQPHYVALMGLSGLVMNQPDIKVGVGFELDFQYPALTTLPVGYKSSHFTSLFYSYLRNTLINSDLLTLDIGPRLGWQWAQANFPLAKISQQGPLVGFHSRLLMKEPILKILWGIHLGLDAIGPLGTYTSSVQEEQPRTPLDPSGLNPMLKDSGSFSFFSFVTKIFSYWNDEDMNRQQTIGLGIHVTSRTYTNLFRNRFDLSNQGKDAQEQSVSFYCHWSYLIP